jgi:alkylhydroperoxidase/carboxymuconolactone decarboxylase family protein YurZ
VSKPTITELADVLSEAKLRLLRSSYHPSEMVSANVAAVASLAPRLQSWNAEIARTFYTSDGPLSAIDRERCLIMLLSYTGPALPLAVHIYWGLMEGLTVDEVCQVVGLAGCYGGLPRTVQGLVALEKVVWLLDRAVDETVLGPTGILQMLIQELAVR